MTREQLYEKLYDWDIDPSQGGIIDKILELCEEAYDKGTVAGRNPTYDNIRNPYRQDEPEIIEHKTVGTLNTEIGIKGYYTCGIGHEVKEEGDRYVIYMKGQSLPDLRVPYYKQDLKPYIDFYKNN